MRELWEFEWLNYLGQNRYELRKPRVLISESAHIHSPDCCLISQSACFSHSCCKDEWIMNMALKSYEHIVHCNLSLALPFTTIWLFNFAWFIELLFHSSRMTGVGVSRLLARAACDAHKFPLLLRVHSTNAHSMKIGFINTIFIRSRSPPQLISVKNSFDPFAYFSLSPARVSYNQLASKAIECVFHLYACTRNENLFCNSRKLQREPYRPTIGMWWVSRERRERRASKDEVEWIIKFPPLAQLCIMCMFLKIEKSSGAR